VLDTRQPGPLTGKLAANEERIVSLGFVGARSAVINLTITQTVGGGFVAVFPADVPYPGNSTINWTASNADDANTVITALDSAGRLKIRGGSNPTHVLIDRVGYLV
jgi:hypothetical protein